MLSDEDDTVTESESYDENHDLNHELEPELVLASIDPELVQSPQTQILTSSSLIQNLDHRLTSFRNSTAQGVRLHEIHSFILPLPYSVNRSQSCVVNQPPISVPITAASISDPFDGTSLAAPYLSTAQSGIYIVGTNQAILPYPQNVFERPSAQLQRTTEDGRAQSRRFWASEASDLSFLLGTFGGDFDGRSGQDSADLTGLIPTAVFPSAASGYMNTGGASTFDFEHIAAYSNDAEQESTAHLVYSPRIYSQNTYQAPISDDGSTYSSVEHAQVSGTWGGQADEIYNLQQLQDEFVRLIQQTSFSSILLGTEIVPRLYTLTNYCRTHLFDLGLADDLVLGYDQRLQFWRVLNRSWISVISRNWQDTSRGLARLTENQLEEMGDFIIDFADGLQSYGLVDYEIGIWEERILNGMQHTLDFMASQRGVFR
ncbi:hypothetical protein V1512DRAFT_256661 [Lipomyces arxii]|uniref:uncharacterized protein n=1 Tax=Lipomyces arxii TaxID=56418 RepID=UPI0034CD728D